MPVFDWDSFKEATNRRKHGLDFSLSQPLWSDPHLVIVYDRFESGEHRFHAVGTIRQSCLVLVHTYPDPLDDEIVRVIGLRKATPAERRRYEEEDAHD